MNEFDADNSGEAAASMACASGSRFGMNAIESGAGLDVMRLQARGRSLRHRWVLHEPVVDAELRVIYEDSRIIVVDKPHGLATTPRGMWYRQTALIRLRELYRDDSITPAHRLDRMTAGVVVFVRDPAMRGAYQTLFQNHHATKVYECLAPSRPIRIPKTGTIRSLEPPRLFPLLRRSCIVKERGVLQAFETPGVPNAVTRIELGTQTATSGSVAHGPRISQSALRHYVLHPITGKTHQLRVHMNALGLPIAGDDLYPGILQHAPEDISSPLQLVARTLQFIDPIDGTPRAYTSSISLDWGVEERV